MKKILILLIISFSSLSIIAQIANFGTLTVGDRFSLGNRKVVGISNDTSLTNSSSDSLATTYAIKKFVLNAVGNSVSNWSILGNSGTTAAQFLGTTDNRSLRFRTNNVERVFLDSTGNFKINGYTNNASHIRAFGLYNTTDASPWFNIAGTSIWSEMNLRFNNVATSGSTGIRLVAGYSDTLEAGGYADLNIVTSDGVKMYTSSSISRYPLFIKQNANPLFTIMGNAMGKSVYIGDTTPVSGASLVVRPNNFIIDGGSLAIGTLSTSAALQVSKSISAGSNVARALYINNTLTATANSDVLLGLDIVPSFANGGFSAVKNYAARLGGHLIFTPDATHNIGEIAANRPANIYVSNGVTLNGVLTTGGGINLNNQGYINQVGDGVFRFINSTLNGFDRLIFGLATTSFPAIKRSSSELQIRLADDSQFGQFQSLYQRYGSGSPEGSVSAPVGSYYSRTDGSTGTSFYIKESGSGNTGWVAGGSSGGSGTVNSGTLNRLTYYSATGTAVSALSALTPNKALLSDGSGLPISSSVSNTELNFLSGVTSNIQDQFNSLNTSLTNPFVFSNGGTAVTTDSNMVRVSSTSAYIKRPLAGAGIGLSQTDTTSTTFNLFSIGLAGGQTIKFGKNSGDNGTLTSTDHVTKGKIYFGSAQATAFDEVNNRLGIATASPATTLDVNGDITPRGNIVYVSHDTYDIGSSATRPRSIYAATGIFSPEIYGSTAASADISIQGTSSGTKTGSYVRLQRSGGNVAIGLNTAATTLDIMGTTSAGFQRVMKLKTGTSADGDAPYIEFSTSATDGYGPQIGGIREATGGLGGLFVKTGTNLQAERFRISDGGNVGIGNTAPSALLDLSRSYSYSSGTNSDNTHRIVSNSSFSGGNNTNNALLVTGTINNTGGANVNRGVLVNLSGTSLTGTSLIAFENIIGNNVFNSTSGSTIIGGNSPAAKFQVTGSVSAASNIARAMYLDNTLTATANGDALIALDIMPTFSNSSFTGVSNYPVRVRNNGGTELFRIDNSGNVRAKQYNVDLTASAPASASATGTAGEVRITANYIYVCTATNTWVRTALSTW